MRESPGSRAGESPGFKAGQSEARAPALFRLWGAPGLSCGMQDL